MGKENKEFLVASTSKCIVISAESINDALEKGMKELDEHPKYGNVAGVPLPTSQEEWVETRRKLVIGHGELFEYFGYPDYMYERLINYCDKELGKIQTFETK